MPSIWGRGNTRLDTVETLTGYNFATNMPLTRVCPVPTRNMEYDGVFDGNSPYLTQTPLVDRLDSDGGLYQARPWVSDPTRAVWDEKTQLWYAWFISNSSSDHPDSSWTQIVSPDMINWVETGFIFYTKNNDMGSSLWGGSVVVDTEGTAGFGKGAALYFITMPGGVDESAYQCTTRWVAPRLGCAPVYDKIVMDNNGPSNDPNNPVRAPGMDFRDARVDWDDDHGYWVMKLTVGRGISFYSSLDTETWAYLSTIELDAWQQIETPDLLKVKTEDGVDKWVLVFSMKSWQGKDRELVGYMIGTWDGKVFTPDQPTPQLFCEGPDFYAQALWQKDGNLYGWGWMSNWDWAGNGATSGYTNTLTTVLQLKVVKGDDNQYRLSYGWLPAQYRCYQQTQQFWPGWLWPNNSYTIPDVCPGIAYRYDIYFQKTSVGWQGPFDIDFGVDPQGSAYTRLTIDPDKGTVHFTRKNSGSSFRTTSAGPVDSFYTDVDTTITKSPAHFHVSIIMDGNGAEIIVNGERYIAANLFLQMGQKALRITNNSGRPFAISRLQLYS